MNIQQLYNGIISDNEQDMAAGKKWFYSLTPKEVNAMWMFMQQDFSDPFMEAMSRLAALQFATFVEELLKELVK